MQSWASAGLSGLRAGCDAAAGQTDGERWGRAKSDLTQDWARARDQDPRNEWLGDDGEGL